MSGRRLCRHLGGWCALTLAWVVGVSSVVAARIGDQVAASEDLARDIAALDGGGQALVTQWQDVVGLMFEHRASLLFEITLLPPLALFGAAMGWLAWRRWAPAAIRRPAYSAAVRRAAPSRFM
jgi:hypothetical protein